jgi:hypothetical protein
MNNRTAPLRIPLDVRADCRIGNFAPPIRVSGKCCGKRD